MSSSTSPKKKMLLLGGYGYIGSHIFKGLEKDYNIDRSSVRIADLGPITGYDIILNCAGRKPGKDVTRAQMFEDNIIASAQLAPLFKYSPAMLIHLSSMAVFNLSSYYGITKIIAEKNLTIEFVRTRILRLPRVVAGNFQCNFSFTKGVHQIWTATQTVIGITQIPALIKDVING